MHLDEYMAHDATALAKLVARKEVTPAELLALARQRAEAVNPTLNAIVRRLDDVADRQAADADLSGAFAGVPFLIKDLYQEYRGFPTSYGSRSLAHDVADEHALVTQRFLDAGLVIFGKTNTSEFGAKGMTEPEYWGPARNPWSTEHTPGGSSGGSGAAVAAGIVPAAGANDGGGSIRVPAACTGLVGLKASRGLTPYGPQTGEIMFGMATQGVVSRTVRDSAALYDAIIGPESARRISGRAPRWPVRRLHQEPTRHPEDWVLRLFRDQPQSRPGSRRRSRGCCDAPQRVGSPGRGSPPALRRCSIGSRLPHHLVRTALQTGRRD